MGTGDVDKVLKGLLPHETCASCCPPNVSRKSGDVKSASSGNFCLQVHVAGRKAPLVLTMKTAMHIVSFYPATRSHRFTHG